MIVMTVRIIPIIMTVTITKRASMIASAMIKIEMSIMKII